MTVTGSAFAINTYGSVFFDINRNGSIDSGEPVQYLTTSASGTFSTTLIVPSTAIGTYPVLAAFASSTAQASVSFTVTTTGTTGASLTLSPTSGAASTAMTVTGSGFAINTYGGVFFDINRNGSIDSGEPVQYLTTSASGTFSTTLVVPSTAIGTYPVLAAFASSTAQASVSFTVTTTGTTGASLTLNPTSGPVGTNVTVNGRGFTGNTEGGVFFDINRNGTTDSGEPLQFMTTAPNGTFTIGLTVPSVPPGTYQILGVIQGAYTASGLLEQSVANFTVTP